VSHKIREKPVPELRSAPDPKREHGEALRRRPAEEDAKTLKDRRAAADAERARLLAAGTPPEECGPELPVAPARGEVETFAPREAVQTEAGPRDRPSGYRGRRAARVRDAFDVMEAQADRRGRSGGPIFTPGQIEAGRAYAALAERVAALGVRFASLESLSSGTRGEGGWIERAVRDIRRLRAIQRWLDAQGLAKEPRRIRPSERGSEEGARRSITVRGLVDGVCLGQQAVDTVLKRHGWASGAKNAAAVQDALRGTLDAMRRYL
jgi:hypothetical protein